MLALHGKGQIRQSPQYRAQLLGTTLVFYESFVTGGAQKIKLRLSIVNIFSCSVIGNAGAYYGLQSLTSVVLSHVEQSEYDTHPKSPPQHDAHPKSPPRGFEYGVTNSPVTKTDALLYFTY